MHPCLALAPSATRRLFWLFLLCTALVGGVMVISGDALRNAAVPAGIFSLELNLGALPAMMASYDEVTLRSLGFQLGLDFLFLPLYSTGLILGLARTWQRAGRTPPGWATPLAWTVWGAAACDVVENIFLYLACVGTPTAALGWGATVFAAIKFAILAVALLAWAGVALRLRQPLRR